MNDSSWMSEMAGLYVTKITYYNTATSGWGKVLSANPRRYNLKVITDFGAAALIWVMPAPVQSKNTPANGTNLPLECKFMDTPGQCTGEWYAFLGGGAGVYLIEELYQGS